MLTFLNTDSETVMLCAEYYVLLWVLVSGVAVWTKMFYWAEADGSLNVLCKFILIIFNMIGVSSLLYELWLKWKNIC